MNSFKKGKIAIGQFGTKTNYYIGKTHMMTCGMKATIIKYKNAKDIDVQFENGNIRKHKSIDGFKKGQIAPTQFHIKTNRIGQTRIMNCGMKATIIAHRSADDIDIQFEDGAIRKHRTVSDFKKGYVAHPTGILFDMYKLENIAFQFHDKTYFYVTYTENNSEISEVMCIDDMKQNYKKNKSQ